jgi:hypothetical protein
MLNKIKKSGQHTWYPVYRLLKLLLVLLFTICGSALSLFSKLRGIAGLKLAFNKPCVSIDDFAPHHGEEVPAFQFPSMKRCIFTL